MCKQMWEDASCEAIYMYAVTYQLFAPKECICLVQKSQETMKIFFFPAFLFIPLLTK